jgi:hypothetical protein
MAEGLLIVVSILIAFAIDAWWADRQDRAEERRILASLQAEYRFNAGWIPRYIEQHRLSADYAQALYRALHEAGPGATVRFPYTQLAHVLTHSSTDPQRGSLDAILQSGELRYLRNPRIRERLVGWPQLVIDATENEDLLRKQWEPLLMAATAKHVDLAPLGEMADACWENPALEICDLGEASIPYDTELIGLLQPVHGYAKEGARELGILVEEAEAIAALIDRELARH